MQRTANSKPTSARRQAGRKSAGRASRRDSVDAGEDLEFYEKKQRIRIDDATFVEFRKSISLQDVIIFNRFSELIAIPTETKRRWSDVKDAVGEKHQSFITKSIRRTREKCEALFDEKIYWDLDNSYTITPFGRRLYELTRRLEHSIASYQEDEIVRENPQQIRFVVNSHSYYMVRKLENVCNELFPDANFETKLMHKRSELVFDEVKHKENVDLGIGESVREHQSGRQLEVIKIAKGRMSLFSNYPIFDKDQPISDKNLRYTNIVGLDELIEANIVIGDTRSFYEYLAIISNRIHKVDDIKISKASKGDLFGIVDGVFNIVTNISSVNMLTDILFLDRKNVCMLATGEVSIKLQALANSSSRIGGLQRLSRKGSGLLGQNRIFRYRIDDGGMRINKYLMRKQEYDDNLRSSIEKKFWEAGLFMNQSLRS